MLKREMTIQLLNMTDAIDTAITDTKQTLEARFTPSTASSNEDVDKECEMNKLMAEHLIYTQLNSTFKKAYDKNKKDLDTQATSLGYDTVAKPEQTIRVYDDGLFSFSKKQNKTGETTLLTDFVTALARVGVPKETVDTALKSATKPKKGNTYYIVETN